MTDPTRPTAFIDCETDGLRADAREWEIGLVRRAPGEDETLHVFHIADFAPALADPKALKLGGFYTRHPRHATDGDVAVLGVSGPDPDKVVEHVCDHEGRIAFRLERMVRDAIVVMCNPAYDVPVLTRALGRHGYAWTGHYRPICATTYAAGVVDQLRAFRGQPPMPLPWSNNDIGAALGITRTNAHDALADACYARDLFDAARAAVKTGW